MKTKNYLEEEFRTYTLFTDESVFESEYIPNGIKHRDNELIFLSRLFLPLLTHPLTISKKILITGSIGVGKTITLHLFGQMIIQSARKRSLNLKYIHINCRHKRTSVSILKTILDELIGGLPSRGLSSRDLLEILVSYLREQQCHLILVLDELGFIFKNDADLIYSLTRINEMHFSDYYYLSFIGIVKDIISLKNLDDATISSLQNEVIRFKKYTEDQIFEILSDRIELGLKPGVIDESVLKMVSSITGTKGDLRVSLKILKDAIRYAEHRQMERITPEIIQEINSNSHSLTYTEICNLKRHELILLSAICNILNNSCGEITMSELKEEYLTVCNFYQEKPRSDTQLWQYIQILKKYEFITTVIKNKNQRGRQSHISIPNYSVSMIKNKIEKLLLGGKV